VFNKDARRLFDCISDRDGAQKLNLVALCMLILCSPQIFLLIANRGEQLQRYIKFN